MSPRAIAIRPIPPGSCATEVLSSHLCGVLHIGLITLASMAVSHKNTPRWMEERQYTFLYAHVSTSLWPPDVGHLIAFRDTHPIT